MLISACLRALLFQRTHCFVCICVSHRTNLQFTARPASRLVLHTLTETRALHNNFHIAEDILDTSLGCPSSSAVIVGWAALVVSRSGRRRLKSRNVELTVLLHSAHATIFLLFHEWSETTALGTGASNVGYMLQH
jgi:hypothetical protein